jgi:hypothetical protein
LEGLNIILNNNLIQFNGQKYIQVKGVAMGTKMAPSYATLTLAFLEEKFLYPKIEKMFGIESALYFKDNYSRFLDDCFLIWQKSRCTVHYIQECLNQLNKELKFTMETNSNNGINFLDLSIKINRKNKIETDIHYKETDGHQYLNYNSCHPKHTKNNIPYNLMNRIFTFVSNEERKYFRISEMKNWLQNLNYPENLIEDAIRKAKDKPAELNKNKSQPQDGTRTINYITNHNPNNTDIYPIVKEVFSMLKTNEDTKKSFQNTNIRKCKRQPQNLKKMLTRAEFNENAKTPTVTKCLRPRCKTCKCIVEGTNFTFENKSIIYINEDMNCMSRNIIYVLSCTKCNKYYVGETSDQLSMRINVHRQEIKDSNLRHLYVSKHIANCRKII